MASRQHRTFPKPSIQVHQVVAQSYLDIILSSKLLISSLLNIQGINRGATSLFRFILNLAVVVGAGRRTAVDDLYDDAVGASALASFGGATCAFLAAALPFLLSAGHTTFCSTALAALASGWHCSSLPTQFFLGARVAALAAYGIFPTLSTCGSFFTLSTGRAFAACLTAS